MSPREVIEEVAAKHGVSLFDLMRRCRLNKVVHARAEIAKRLDAQRFTVSEIGRLLNKDHTTIVYYLGRAKRKWKSVAGKPRWRRPRVKHLCWIRTAKNAEPQVPPVRRRKFKLIRYCGYEPRKPRRAAA